MPSTSCSWVNLLSVPMPALREELPSSLWPLKTLGLSGVKQPTQGPTCRKWQRNPGCDHPQPLCPFWPQGSLSLLSIPLS